ncbi:MAG: LCP family protein [Lachnospiraceae bacterium]|nr:LCP family protein [Lachnospiraceae bacterium]
MDSKKLKQALPQIAWTISIVLEIVLAGVLIYMDKLPTKYLAVILIILALAGFLTASLLLTREKKKNKVSATRVTGYVLAFLISVVSVAGSVMGLQVETTIENIVANGDDLAATVGVYVMADDNADSLSDASGYLFGQLLNYDPQRKQQSIDAIEKEVGGNIQTSDSESAFTLAEALYEGSCGAIILDEAYSSLLMEGVDDDEENPFMNFESDTKLIYEIPIYKTEEEIQEEEAKADKDITKDTIYVYISGSDTRSSKLTASRSDVNIIAEINPTTHEILLISTPRDYYVPNPAGGGAKDKLTHCGIYGVENSEAALEELYGIEFDYYVQVNFTGFEKLIDAIGGIKVNSIYGFTSYNYGGTYTFQKGENFIGGKEALAFARDRFEVPGGDVTRGINQMAVIHGVVDKLTGSTSALSNYPDILKSLEGMFATDMGNEDVSKLARMQLDENPTWNIHSFSLNGTGGKESNYSMSGVKSYVMYVDESMVSFAKDLMTRVENGETLTDEDVIYGAEQ